MEIFIRETVCLVARFSEVMSVAVDNVKLCMAHIYVLKLLLSNILMSRKSSRD